MTNREKHIQVLDELHKKHLSTMKDTDEFVWDGPSNWELYENSFPRIMCLVKEARNGYHPSAPNQKTDTKFMRNLARWSYLIREAFQSNTPPSMPSNAELPETNDMLAIVEVKKINEEKTFSNYHDLNKYAIDDRDFLKRQIDLIAPNVVLCTNTLDFYDAIYDWTHLSDKKLIAIGNNSCWLSDNRLVIGFYHPSTFGWGDPSKKDDEYFSLLTKLLFDETVKGAIAEITP